MKPIFLLCSVLCIQLALLHGADNLVKYPTLADALLSDDPGVIRFQEVSGRLDWFVSEGNAKLSPHPEDIQFKSREVSFNTATLYPGLATILHFANLDMMGQYIVKVVPNLPDINVVGKLSSARQARLSLGVPIVSFPHEIKLWNFIQYLDDEYRVMTIEIGFDRKGNAIRKLVGIGKVASRTIPKQ